MSLSEKLARAKAFLTSRQQAYRLVFTGPMADKVLRDLARFCRANESTFHSDPRMHAVLEGRREVILRICKHLKIDTQTFLKMYGVSDE